MELTERWERAEGEMIRTLTQSPPPVIHGFGFDRPLDSFRTDLCVGVIRSDGGGPLRDGCS